MANRPIYFRELLDVEVTVWRSREGGDTQLDVRFTKRSKASRGVQRFGMSDMAAIKLLADDIGSMFSPGEAAEKFQVPEEASD